VLVHRYIILLQGCEIVGYLSLICKQLTAATHITAACECVRVRVRVCVCLLHGLSAPNVLHVLHVLHVLARLK